MANFIQMMQKAQQFKQQMQHMQERVQQMDITGEAGRGLVKCHVTGKLEMKSISIDPSLLKIEEREVLEDLIVAAVNDARLRVEKIMTDETQKMMKDMGLPQGVDLPF